MPDERYLPYGECACGSGSCSCCCTCNSSDDSDDDRPEYERERVIQDHGYRPDRLVFRGKGPWHLGVEIEVHAPEAYTTGYWGGEELDFSALERVARDAQEDLGDVCWLQEDGSVSYGFEITTHPMTYRWAIKHFPWGALERLSDQGFWVDNGVGIHVHVSRSAFSSECHLYRWMKFVYRNAEQVQRLARRRNSRWAPFTESNRERIKHYMKGPDDCADRYQAINPVNRDTLEVRVFASSLRPSEVKAALAFVASSVEYTRDLDANKIISKRGWAWSSYVDWLRQPAQDIYRPILDELEALLCVS